MSLEERITWQPGDAEIIPPQEEDEIELDPELREAILPSEY